MGVVHFLNVKEGNCTWIAHPSGRDTIIDVSNASLSDESEEIRVNESSAVNTRGNYNQKNHPVNPITYLRKFGVKRIFRFILTHPDMDHLDGIEDLFSCFSVLNFWDTSNNKVMDESTSWGKYKQTDWNFYQTIRKKESSPKTLHLYTGSEGKYFNENEDGTSGADGLYILAPTKDLIALANKSKNYNDGSYVILYRTGNNKKIIFAGDSAENTWKYIIENHESIVSDIDVLIAPHHGRKSGGDEEYLDTLNPKLTIFGNARSEHLDYNSWNNRNLNFITNNQANCVILDSSSGNIDIFVTHEKFAKDYYKEARYSNKYDAWYIGKV